MPTCSANCGVAGGSMPGPLRARSAVLVTALTIVTSRRATAPGRAPGSTRSTPRALALFIGASSLCGWGADSVMLKFPDGCDQLYGEGISREPGGLSIPPAIARDRV